jgi:hypothetical protein
MPKKKSVKRAAQEFIDEVGKIEAYTAQPSVHPQWVCELAILRLYRGFERLMLHALVGAINNDTSTLSARTGIAFPKHLTDEVCEYLIVADGYFDFRGRDGLIKTLKGFVPDGHYLLATIKADKYRDTLERLSALRNYAAHDSAISKQRAREAVGQVKIQSAGLWLSKQGRFKTLAGKCHELAEDIKNAAPY